MSELPRDFGRYEALAPLGKGGMGEVFIGRLRGKAGFSRAVAIKTLLPHLASDEATAEMFLSEARNAACIHDPHVVQTYDLGETEDGSLFFVMELVHGETLDTLADLAGTPPLSVAIEIVAQAADGLAAAHGACGPDGEALGLVHCDVSPQNILVGADGLARVVDFGIARAVRTGSVTGTFRGKIGYVAPEQLSGDKVGPDTDIFVLGIVLWELLTGECLFVGSHPLAVLERVQNRPVPPVSDFRDDAPASLIELVAWALKRERAARPGSAKEFARALRSVALDAGLSMTVDELASWVEQTAGPILFERRATIDQALRAAPRDVARAPKGGGAWRVAAGVVGALALAVPLVVLSTSPVGPAPVAAAPAAGLSPETPPAEAFQTTPANQTPRAPHGIAEASRERPVRTPRAEGAEAEPALTSIAPARAAARRPRPASGSSSHADIAPPAVVAPHNVPPRDIAPRDVAPRDVATPEVATPANERSNREPEDSLIGIGAFDAFVGGQP